MLIVLLPKVTLHLLKFQTSSYVLLRYIGLVESTYMLLNSARDPSTVTSQTSYQEIAVNTAFNAYEGCTEKISNVSPRLRACLPGGGGPQISEVTCGGSPHLQCKRDQIKMRDYMVRRVTPPKREAILRTVRKYFVYILSYILLNLSRIRSNSNHFHKVWAACG